MWGIWGTRGMRGNTGYVGYMGYGGYMGYSNHAVFFLSVSPYGCVNKNVTICDSYKKEVYLHFFIFFKLNLKVITMFLYSVFCSF